MKDLLSCPFCGGEAEIHTTYDMDSLQTDGYFVWCDNERCECRPETNEHLTEEQAIAAWNTRADHHGYEQAAIEAWENIKAWNTRAERTCHMIVYKQDKDKPRHEQWGVCSECREVLEHSDNYCPNCGSRVLEENDG